MAVNNEKFEFCGHELNFTQLETALSIVTPVIQNVAMELAILGKKDEEIANATHCAAFAIINTMKIKNLTP